MAVSYVVMFFLIPFLFTNKTPSSKNLSAGSIIFILFSSFASYLLADLFPSEFWGNRFLHTFGGGFLAYLTCYLATKDSKVHIRRAQFFVLSFLVVIALGNVNEVFEFILHNTTNIVFAETINDTWLDLCCNIIGALVAALIFTPNIKYSRHE